MSHFLFSQEIRQLRQTAEIVVLKTKKGGGMRLVIRLATKEDSSSILRVINQSYNPYKNLIPANCGFVTSIEEIIKIMKDESSSCWVAENNDSVIGVATGITIAPRAYHLKLLFIAEHAQRKGIASNLLSTYENSGKKKGYKLLTTNYQKWAPWSRNFYLKQGYKEYIEGDELDFPDLHETISFYRRIGKLNNDRKCFIWKKTC